MMNESTQIRIQNLFLIVYHIFHLAKSIALRAGHSTQLSGGSLPTSYRCIRCRPLTRLQLSVPPQNKAILCVDATVGTHFWTALLDSAHKFTPPGSPLPVHPILAGFLFDPSILTWFGRSK